MTNGNILYFKLFHLCTFRAMRGPILISLLCRAFSTSVCTCVCSEHIPLDDEV